jgi:hypothetical protein
MTDSPTTPSQRVRIHSHVTQSRFLHVEDALGIGKIRLFAGNYRRGQGMDSHAYHFIDLADARVIFAALARGEPGFSYREYKGTPANKRGTGWSGTAGRATFAERRATPDKVRTGDQPGAFHRREGRQRVHGAEKRPR